LIEGPLDNGSKDRSSHSTKPGTNPEPNYSAIKCLVASGRQSTGSVKEESVVSVVLLPNGGWVSIVNTRFTGGSPKLELTKEWGGEEEKSKYGETTDE